MTAHVSITVFLNKPALFWTNSATSNAAICPLMNNMAYRTCSSAPNICSSRPMMAGIHRTEIDRTATDARATLRGPRVGLPWMLPRGTPCARESRGTPQQVNRTTSTCDEGVLQTLNRPAGTECVLAGPYLERPMSLQVELCEHLAKDCLQAAERTKDPQTRELLLRHAVQWMQDALAALNQSRAARRTRPS